MNKLKSGLNLSDSEDNTENQREDVEDHINDELTNGHSDDINHHINGSAVTNNTEDEAVRPIVNGNHEVAGPSGPSTASSSSQAFGGARPKTFRARLRNSETSSGRSRNSDSVEIRVVSCDSTDGPSEPHYEDINNVPKLETLPNINQRINIADISSSRDREELDTGEAMVEDDCYIYTYIGGTAYLSADLPNSFFRLDSGSDGESLPGVAGAGQSNLSTGVAALIQDQMVTSPHSPRVRSFCPDQDFIEMDFDPGSDSNDDSDDGDSGQGQDGGDDDGEQEEADEDVIGAGSMEDEDRVLSVSPPVHHLVLDSILLPPNNNNEPSKEPESHNQEYEAAASAAALLPTIAASPTYPASAPVLSPSDEVTILMPRSKSLNSSLGDCLMMAPDPPTRTKIANLSLCGSRLLQREAMLFSGDGDEDNRLQPEPDLASALQRLALPSTSGCNPLHSCVTQKAMIWTEKEAVRKQVTQTPNTSSCGAVALLNVVLALDLDCDLQVVADSVNTRLRRPDSSLPDYLLSRSEAGCTHQDLISAVNNVLSGQVRARFFPLHNRVVQLSQMLVSWISLGLVPVLTLNVQKGPPCPDGQLQDSWHHQMVWGVSGQDVYLANPLDVMSEQTLLPQIQSPSELLIRREDVVSRFQSSLDLMEVNRLGHRWREMNVLGQVVNIIREKRYLDKEEAQLLLESSHDTIVTLASHVNIPASYTAGVTLFCSADNQEGIRCIMESPEFPCKK